jgi:hypothetical protein
MGTLTIEMTPELVRQLAEEAGRRGQTAEEVVRTVLEARFAPATPAAQRERNQAAIALLRRWRKEPLDLEEAKGYPVEITPLSLGEVRID